MSPVVFNIQVDTGVVLLALARRLSIPHLTLKLTYITAWAGCQKTISSEILLNNEYRYIVYLYRKFFHDDNIRTNDAKLAECEVCC
jgi:hypothetical protein